jgi:Tfp pilus assembly protein PilO
MASSGVMADFARLPPERKVLVFGVIGLLLGAVYFQFGYKPLNEEHEQLVAQNRAKVQQDKKLADDLPKYEALKARMADLTKRIAENQKALPTEAEVPAFFETLERKVTEAGVEIHKWTKLKEETVEGFVRVPVEIEIRGTFMQIKRFFASLVQKDVAPASGLSPTIEERDRIISIENLSLTDPKVKNREIQLNAKFVAVTFRQEDSEAAKLPGQPAAAKPSTAAPPPLPSATTPKGAKAQTESALEKGDEVNRNAAGVNEAKTPAAAGVERLKGGI